MGSYQAGVYEAMAAFDQRPGWVAGISIGAINGALIAGNAPGYSVAALRAFWEEVTKPTALWPAAPGPFGDGQRAVSAAASALFGQPGFFKPRSPLDFLPGRSVTSYYDTSALRGTLERLVDFDRVNAGETRLSVGAVSVTTGRLVWFDSLRTRLGPDHIMASGALPPGFPPVEIDGELYWDGGIVSNTPLEYVIDEYPRDPQLCFQVDLFHANGTSPTSLEEVTEREKDIRYASRTRAGTQTMGEIQSLRLAIGELIARLPPEFRDAPEIARIDELSCDATFDIAHLIYRPLLPQGASKDYEFSRATMQARWDQGRSDADETLRAAPWRAPRKPGEGVRMFDVVHDRLMADQRAESAQR